MREATGYLVGLLAFCCVSPLWAAAPPNVVLIISDDQSWTDYGFMGHKTIQTPNLDRLARESVVFRRGYVPTALCRSSLATLATGMFAHQHLTTGNDPAKTPANAKRAQGGADIREMLISHIDRLPTLPQRLSKLGYVSHQSGKWWEGSFQRGGFTHGMTRGFPKPGGRHGDDGLQIGRTGMRPVLDFIDGAVDSNKPFFVWYAPFLPHTPHNPPERLLKKYVGDGRSLHVARYYAMCEWFDETCGELLGHIDKQEIRDNTLVIYVTDNGWIQRSDSRGYAPRSKRSPNEGGTRTPIMFRWPSRFSAAERPELCSSIDIVPTILAAAGLDVPDNLPGLNVLPALESKQNIDRRQIFGEAFAHDIADIDQPQASLVFRWVIRDNWKLILTYDGRQGAMKYRPTDFRPQLYNLSKDPAEQQNLAQQEPERVKELAEAIGNWWPVGDRRTLTTWSPQPVVLETNE